MRILIIALSIITTGFLTTSSVAAFMEWLDTD